MQVTGAVYPGEEEAEGGPHWKTSLHGCLISSCISTAAAVTSMMQRELPDTYTVSLCVAE